MRFFKFLSIFLTFLFTCNSVFAFKYSNEDKDMFYSAFLEGYFTEIEKAVNKLDMEQEKKENFIKTIKENTNKKFLEDSSWSCIQTYPIRQIVAASVICTAPWANEQAEINKKLYEQIK